MKRIREIISAYLNLLRGKKKDLAAERLEICSTCPFKATMLGLEVCGVCHCVLEAKARSNENSCPEAKWTR